jgi:PAS domain-containing protein
MGVQHDVSNNGLELIPVRNGYSGKAITDIITNGFFTVDRHWTVIYWNSAAEKLLGMPAHDIMGKNLWNVFVEIIPLNFYHVYHKAFLQDIPTHFTEYWAEKECWFDVITYHYDDSLSVSFKNRSQELRPDHSAYPRHQLRILNELYRFVTEVTNDCLWEWNLQTKEIFWVDGGHKRVFGYPIENALVPQRFWENKIHPEDRVRILSRLNKIIDAGETEWKDDYRFQKANGEYAYVHDRGHFISEGNIPIARMIGATRDVTASKLNELKLVQERKSRQHQITNAVLTAQEKERADIGRELHDNLSQVLGATKLYIELAKTDDKNRKLCLDKSTTYINQMIDEIRKISKFLIAPGMAMGLVESIYLIIDDLRITHPLIIEFDSKGISEKAIPEKLQLDIFRIVQEQLNNIVRHSKATHASIKLTTGQKQIMLVISDNGKGSDPALLSKGVGVINIKSRAEQHGGSVKIVSEPGKGYGIKVIFQL